MVDPNDVIICGTGRDAEPQSVVDVRCPDCGPVVADVIESDREGVTVMQCPVCGDTLRACGLIGRERMRAKEVVFTQQGHGGNQGAGGSDDDGE